MTSTLLTQIDDALTAAAIVIGGAFAYLKFIKGRVLTAAVGYEITAAVTAHTVTRRHTPLHSSTGAIAVEVAIRNNGQVALTVPRDSVQLVSVSSITAEELGRHGHDLTQEASPRDGCGATARTTAATCFATRSASSSARSAAGPVTRKARTRAGTADPSRAKRPGPPPLRAGTARRVLAPPVP